ncbi:Histidine--tRNA ligase [bioreactor metagenome]|uniref:histidine--tRNA ligase n=1 Tax=bioreactor metagenome TaxID=1076179 RepID=A0A645CRS4_9ZZZZ
MRATLINELGVAPAAAKTLLELLAAQDPLAALRPYKGRSQLLDAGVSELSALMKYLAAFGVPPTHCRVDLTIARGLDYYTGTVYETVMLDHPEIGSICSGGRYDNLASYYTGKLLPGVGISIGLTRLFYVLEEQGYLNDALVTAPADVLILPMTEDLTAAISLATALREAGVRTQLHLEDKKFKQKLSYADKLGIPYAVFLGEDEAAAGTVTVKDLVSGEQSTLQPAQAIAEISAGLRRRTGGAPILDKGTI